VPHPRVWPALDSKGDRAPDNNRLRKWSVQARPRAAPADEFGPGPRVCFWGRRRTSNERCRARDTTEAPWRPRRDVPACTCAGAPARRRLAPSHLARVRPRRAFCVPRRRPHPPVADGPSRHGPPAHRCRCDGSTPRYGSMILGTRRAGPRSCDLLQCRDELVVYKHMGTTARRSRGRWRGCTTHIVPCT